MNYIIRYNTGILSSSILTVHCFASTTKQARKHALAISARTGYKLLTCTPKHNIKQVVV